MIIYDKCTRYSEISGEPYESYIFKEIRCDFYGVVIGEDTDFHYEPSILFDYQDSDPCFGSDGEEFDFGKKYNIPMFAFLNSEYHFLSDYYNSKFANVDMMRYHLANGDMSFENMCRVSRIETAIKLIESGVITPRQLYIS